MSSTAFPLTPAFSKKSDPLAQAFFALASESLEPLDLRIHLRHLEEIFEVCSPIFDPHHPESLWKALQSEIEKQLQSLEDAQEKYSAVLKLLSEDPQHCEKILLTYLNEERALLYKKSQRLTNLPPFFDMEMLHENFLLRYRNRSILLEILLLLGCACLKKAEAEKQKQLSSLLLNIFQKNLRWQTRLVCLKGALRLSPSLPNDPWASFLPIYCTTPQEHLWLQAYAYSLWMALDSEKATHAIQQEFRTIPNPQHFFLRQHLVKLLEQAHIWNALFNLLQHPDPSEMVMLQVITSIAPRFPTQVLVVFSEERYSLKLKAHALVQIVTGANADIAGKLLCEQMQQLTPNPFFARIVLEETYHWLKRNYPHHPLAQSVFQQLRNLGATLVAPLLKNLALEFIERILQTQLPYNLLIEEKLFARLETLPSGKKIKIQKTEIPLPSDLLGRHLTRYCAKNFSVQIQETPKFWIFFHGACARRSLWRFLHELRNPSPEKRRTISHLVGNQALGTLRVPSLILSELSKTKVPGEHTYLESQGGWSPHIPTIEDFLSLFRFSWRGKLISLFTFRGITRLQGPQQHCRWYFFKMSWNYESLDHFRKRACENPQEMKAFQEHLIQNYKIRFFVEPYSEKG